MSNFIPLAPVTADAGRWKPVFRAFPASVELLTEVGWVDFQALFNDKYLGAVVPFTGNGYNVGGYGVKDHPWGQWEVTDLFPRIGSVNPVSGEVVFVRPSKFIFYQYEGRLVHVKMRGVDMLTTLFADWWLRPKYGRGWKFVLGDDVVRNTGGNYQLLNKFNVDMYGEWRPDVAGLLGEELMLGGSVSGVSGLGSGRAGGNGVLLDAVGSGIKCFVDSPIVVHPKKHVKRRRVWDLFSFETVDPVTGLKVAADRVQVDVPSFNVVVEPFHNIIVRRGRKDDNPRTLWVGGPVVFGDGLDKAELRVSSVVGGSGGSYSALRPDFRSISSDRLKDK